MSAATTALINKLTADSLLISDELDRLDCAVLIEEYAAALPASMASTSTNIASYSISGRTISYRSLNELNRRVAELRSQIEACLYGKNGVIDCRYELSDGVRQ